MRLVIDTAKATGVSAIIAMDMAAVVYARQIGIEVHISTQLNITNIESVRFYSQFTDVMVLAREVSLDKAQKISQAIEQQQIKGPHGRLVQIEMFVHGALCMAVSGKCYLSLHDQNKSANKGQCMQNCRKSYIVTEKESGMQLEIDNEQIMSPSDLCTIGFVDQLLAAGVTVFKIEGRARPGEYVKTVASCYKEAVDAYFEGTYTKEKIDAWETRLKTVFNRGFWGGYYLGQKIGDWTKAYGSKATKVKVYVGKVTNYFTKIEVAEFKIEAAELKTGDEIVVLGPTTGVVESIVGEIRNETQASVSTVSQGETITLPSPTLLRRGDKLYKLVPTVYAIQPVLNQ
jgi:putative protease